MTCGGKRTCSAVTSHGFSLLLQLEPCYRKHNKKSANAKAVTNGVATCEGCTSKRTLRDNPVSNFAKAKESEVTY